MSDELSADRKELIREISHRVTAIKKLVRMIRARKVANHMPHFIKTVPLLTKKRCVPTSPPSATTSTTSKWR